MLVGLEIYGLILRCLSNVRTDTTYPAVSLEVAATLAIVGVIYLEHRHALRTSAWFALYLLLGVLIDATKSRSYFIRGLTSSGGVSVATGFVRCIILCLEEIPTRSLIIDPDLRRICYGEATSGFIARSFFVFLRPMMQIGYRGTLSLDDLASLGPEFSSAHLFSKISLAWAANGRQKKYSLFLACCVAFQGAIIAIALPRLCVTGFTFAQPFLMNSVIASVDGPEPSGEVKGGLVAAAFLTFGGASMCRAAFKHLVNQLVTLVRGALISLLFDKSYRLRLSDAKRQQAITLMSADFDGIAVGFPAFVEIPFLLFESGLGMYFLSRFVAQNCLVIFIPLILATVAGIMFGRYMAPALQGWNEHIETRVTKTSRILAQLPALKSLGLGPQLTAFMHYLRILETKASNKFRYLQAASLGSVGVVGLMTPVVVVAASLLNNAFGKEISSQVLYPVLGIVTLLQGPLPQLLRIYPSAMSMLGCFERLQLFLCQDEHVDSRAVTALGRQEASQSSMPSYGASPGQWQQSTATESSPVLRLQNAQIAPRGVKKALLRDVNFSVNEGSVIAMVGPTSSGKTTILQSMLGEAEVLAGNVYIDEAATTIAFCGQQVWLPNVTVRECIVGSCEYNAAWFNTVIIYCKLMEDIERLPNGEDYVIGSEGFALSGGQRQRIGIARSVYARTKVIIFDDIFSSLDASTAKDILMGLCGNGGLLRQSRCAVVLATYLPECVDVADELVLLHGNGKVSCVPCRGNTALEGEAAQLLRQSLGASNYNDPADNQEGGSDGAGPAGSALPSPLAAEPDVVHARRRGDPSLYSMWIGAIGWIRMFLFVLFNLIMSLSEIFPAVYINIWIKVAPDNKMYLLGYALVSVSTGLLGSMCLCLMFISLAPRASIGLHKRLAVAVMQSTLGFLSSTDAGSILNRFSVDMDLLSKRIPSAVYDTLYCFFTTAGQVGTILYGATYITAILPVVLLCLFLIQRYYLRTSRQLRHIELEAQAPLVTAMRDNATGIIYIRGLRSQEHCFARSLHLLDQSQKPFYFQLCSQVMLALVMDLLATAVAVVLTIFIQYIRGSASQNATGLAYLNLIVLGSSFDRTIQTWTRMETSMGALSRLREFLNRTPTEAKPTAMDLPQDWPSSGQVQVRGLYARYKADMEDDQLPILRDVSFTVAPGKKIGIMGRSGSGKSSLLYALLGFLEYEGSIVIDDVDIARVQPDALRARIITISQDVVELDGTVRDNLLPYEKKWDVKQAPLDEKGMSEAREKDQILRETLVRLRLWDQLHERGGLSAELDQVGYSQGEKQLFCIARAVVRRRLTGCKLLLVDEATASVDHWLDQIVREMMVEFFEGCTIIVVAHRAETIAGSNSTIFMADGRIDRIRHK